MCMFLLNIVIAIVTITSPTYLQANGVLIKNGKTSGTNYSVVLLLCKLRPQYTFSHTRKSEPPLLGMVALAIALPPPSVHEIRLECDMFVTRISFDFKIAHVEPRVSDLLDYNPEDLINRSMYALCHAEDADRLRKSHSDLIEKGQVLTGYFRFMNKRSGYIYMQCCATVVCSTKNSDEQNIICVNYVISNCENENLVLDTCQLELDVDIIKREEQNNEKSSGPDSPTNNDPISDQPTNIESTIRPKSESESQKRNNCIPSGRSSRTPTPQANSNMNLVKESGSPSSSIEDGESSTVSSILPISSLTNSKRKRKSKTAFVPIQNSPVLNETQSLAKIITTNNCLLSESNADNTPNIKSRAESGTTTEQNQNLESSVRDLENAMSKHLPEQTEVVNGVNNPSNNNNTDFSTNSLLKQQQQSEKSSTIQWIGSTPNYRQPSPMPATALLRQLYANRESVIRATTRQTPTGVFYDTSQNAALPTPPASESSYEQQYLQLHSQKPNSSSDAFTNLVSTYGNYHSTLDYHNTMTPPSSVSPRESNNSMNNNGGPTSKILDHGNSVEGTDAIIVGSYEYGADPLRSQYTAHSGPENVTPTLLLKPQPYSAAAALHHSHGAPEIVYNNLDQHAASQSQYFTTHSSFHLYHKGSSAGGWYSTPS